MVVAGVSRRSKPKGLNRLMVCMPHGELIYGRFLDDWLRILRWLWGPGRNLVVDVLPVTGHDFPSPHNRCIERALEHRRWREVDYLVFMEHDHLFPTNVLERVAHYEDPVVGAFYVQRLDPYWPVSIVPKPEHWKDRDMWRGEGWSRDKQTFLWPSLMQEWLAAGELQQVLAMGMGLTAIRRDVVEAFGPRPFYHPSAEDAAQSMTFDVLWCREVRRRGWDVYQDFGVELPHLALLPVTSQDHIAAMERRLVAQAA